jgi:hypothetical protein
MKVNHSVLGTCEFLIQFEGKVNQLVLLKSDNTEVKGKIVGISLSSKPRHWLLWGPVGSNIEDLGKTCLIDKNGNTLSQTKATQTFMRASKFIDRLTINKING